MLINILANNVDRASIEGRLQDDISTLRPKISEALGAEKYPIERLRLIYFGKQLEDGLPLFQYDIKHGCTILVFLKAIQLPEEVASPSDAMEVGIPAPKVEAVSVAAGNEPSRSSVNATASNINSGDPDQETKMLLDTFLDNDDYLCDKCKKKPNRKCKECGCAQCGNKDDPEDKTIVCEECASWYHWDCLTPKLVALPEDDWYCKGCINDHEKILTAGKKLDVSKTKKAKQPSANQTKKWGGGMACVGRSRTCTIVGKDHFGKIPGVPVGTSWQYRISCSESGVHRPPVTGIAGTEKYGGAVSIVLSGGYPEDKDEGDRFYYTGSGGRDLSGNKRTAKQSFDQVLEKGNLALAITCNAPVDKEKGATAKDWKKSKPIRVVRGEGLKQHSPRYAPEKGLRYDGLYKIVKYWPEKGKSGFIVWRYLLRRDDDEPAPWTTEGKNRIKELGLKMIMADLKKRKLNEEQEAGESSSLPQKKINTYKPPTELKTLIKKDTLNQRVWKIVLESGSENETDFVRRIEDEFKCPVCLCFVQAPVTLPCKHTICRGCMQYSINAGVEKCPNCRADINLTNENDKVVKFKLELNQEFINAMRVILPNYAEDALQKGKNDGKKRA